MKFAYFVPLLTFIIPTAIISAILFIIDTPPPPLQLGGFVLMLIGACGTYYMGVKKVFTDLNEKGKSGGLNA